MMAATGWRAADVRAVIGVPLYNGVRRGHIHEALHSLLSQTYPHVAFVFVDDGSTDETPGVVAAMGGGHPRVTLVHNPTRLGLVANWIRVFRIGRERFPGASYFAWGSDHDRWEPGWLERLVRELDEHPEAVLAFPGFTRIDEHDRPLKRPQVLRSTAGMPRRERFEAACAKIGAGKLIYGLFRTEALERAGVYSLVYQPDIYLMLELSLYGEFRVVNDMLWYRRDGSRGSAEQRAPKPAGRAPRFVRSAEWVERIGRRMRIGAVTRQHRHIFIGRVPWYARLPAWLQHLGLFTWRLIVLGNGRPSLGRWEAARYAGRLLVTRLSAPRDPKQARQLRRQRTGGHRLVSK